MNLKENVCLFNNSEIFYNCRNNKLGQRVNDKLLQTKDKENHLYHQNITYIIINLPNPKKHMKNKAINL